MAKLGVEARVTIGELSRRGMSRSAIGRALGVTEGAVRYHLGRQGAGAVDGRSRQVHRAFACREAIEHWVAGLGEDGALNLAALHEWLVSEHGYEGSLRSVQRYVARRYPSPALRARRRVETPPGAQAQADWAHWRGVVLAGERVDLLAFHLKLSHSRHEAVNWSPRRDLLSWLHVHNECFRRLEGIPASVRVDNERTAVSRGAGAWGEINPTYERYAQSVRFHVDACPPRAPEAKGKVERGIRTDRGWLDVTRRSWDSLEEIQAWTDERTELAARRRLCPATGTSIYEAWQAEREHLRPLPAVLPEPFDLAVTRAVEQGCTVAFEGRTYSVPFHLLGRRVEVRGCARTVQVLHAASIVASHPRHTPERILLDPRHYEGPSTPEVIAPTPLGKMGRRLAEIAAMEPQRRPVDLYAALAEVAR